MQKYSQEEKGIEYHYFCIGSNAQVSDFEVTSECVINHVKKTFQNGNYVANSIKDRSNINTNSWDP